MTNFWGPKIDKKVINSSTKCLISVKIAILTPHIIPPSLVNICLIFNLQKYVKWLCVFLEFNPCFQRAHVFCMDLQETQRGPHRSVQNHEWPSWYETFRSLLDVTQHRYQRSWIQTLQETPEERPEPKEILLFTTGGRCLEQASWRCG